MRAVFELLGPILLLIGLGAGLERSRFFSAGTAELLNRFCYWIALPALILGSLTRGGPGSGAGWAAWGGRDLTALAGTTVAATALGWVVAGLLRLRWEDRGTFTQAFFRGNLAFVGLPILLKAPGVEPAGLMMLLAPMMVLYNLLAVGVLVASRHGLGWRTVRPLAGEWLRNPIIWSSAVGGVAYAGGLVLPEPLGETVNLVGRMAVPLALITVGAVLAGLPTGAWRGAAWVATAGKVLVSPVLGWGFAELLGIVGPQRLVLLVAAACPTAIISYPMARAMGGDGAMAAQAVVASTLASAGVLAGLIAYGSP